MLIVYSKRVLPTSNRSLFGFLKVLSQKASSMALRCHAVVEQCLSLVIVVQLLFLFFIELSVLLIKLEVSHSRKFLVLSERIYMTYFFVETDVKAIGMS